MLRASRATRRAPYTRAVGVCTVRTTHATQGAPSCGAAGAGAARSGSGRARATAAAATRRAASKRASCTALGGAGRAGCAEPVWRPRAASCRAPRAWEGNPADPRSGMPNVCVLFLVDTCSRESHTSSREARDALALKTEHNPILPPCPPGPQSSKTSHCRDPTEVSWVAAQVCVAAPTMPLTSSPCRCRPSGCSPTGRGPRSCQPGPTRPTV